MTNSVLPADSDDAARRLWLGAATVAGSGGWVATAVPFVASFAPSEKARALGAPVDVDVGSLRPGELRTVEWHGMPVFVLRRTPEMFDALAQHDALLADPQSRRSEQPEAARNALRSRRPDLAVIEAVCTAWAASPPSGPRRQPGPRRAMAGRLLLPPPRVEVRPRRSRVQERAGTDQSDDIVFEFPPGCLEAGRLAR